MAQPRTSRPFQERFLDGFDRSQLRQEVQKVKPKRFQGLRKKYATWALGASLAFGGIGVPLKMVQEAKPAGGGSPKSAASMSVAPVSNDITRDLMAAKSIAEQVAGGVQAVGQGVQAATGSPLKTVAEAPRKLAVVTDNVKEQFFKKEVPFGAIIYAEAQKHGVPPELVAAVVQAESRFKPTARSGVGAQGLMQLMPRTGRWMGARDLTNPTQNIQAGTKYLKYLNERFDGNETKVIAAYNAGEGNVKRFGGVPPFKETRNYVKKVRNYKADYAAQIASMQIADAR